MEVSWLNKITNKKFQIPNMEDGIWDLKIWNLKSKVDNLDNNDLKKCIKEFEELIDKYASPKTKDDARKNVNLTKTDFKLNPIINPCSH